MLAVIGGTGVTQLDKLQIKHRQVIRTPYGEPSGALLFGVINEQEVVFIARHGYGHNIPPHEINYRANIWALAEQNVTHVVSVCAVSGIQAHLAPGELVVPTQIIDYTHNRKHTFFDESNQAITYVDFTQPYCAELRQRIIAAAQPQTIHDGGVYAVTQGPRLETAAEINRIARDGADMVGMTGMPEAALAREAGLRYATISVVSHWAPGRGDSHQQINLEQAGGVFQQGIARVQSILENLASQTPSK